MTVLLPSLATMREVTMGLCARATFRLKAGNFDGFMSDVMAAKQMARRIGQGQGTVIENLVGVVIDSLASRSIGTVAGTGVLSSVQSAELKKAIDGLAPLPRAWEAIDTFERWTVLDCVVLLATGKGELFQDLLVSDYEADLDLAWVDWNAVLKRVNALYDRQVAIMKMLDLEEMERETKKLAEEKEKLDMEDGWAQRREGDTREAYTQRVGDGIVSQFFPILGKAEELYRRSLMEHEMAKVTVAVNGYRTDTGKWPESLDALVPVYLKDGRGPMDIYSGKKVLYAQSEKGIRVYSVGPNRQDDGGKAGVMQNGKRADDIVVGVEVEAGGQ